MAGLSARRRQVVHHRATPSPPNKEALVRHFARAMRGPDGLHPGSRHGHGRDGHGLGPRRDRSLRRPVARSSAASRSTRWAPPATACAIAAEVIQDFTDVRLDGATVSIQGYGNVGQHAARVPGRTRRHPDDRHRSRRHALRPQGHRRRQADRLDAGDGRTSRLRGRRAAAHGRVHRPRVRHLRPRGATRRHRRERTRTVSSARSSSRARTSRAPPKAERILHERGISRRAGLRRQRRRRDLRVGRVPRRHQEERVRHDRGEGPREHRRRSSRPPGATTRCRARRPSASRSSAWPRPWPTGAAPRGPPRPDRGSAHADRPDPRTREAGDALGRHDREERAPRGPR